MLARKHDRHQLFSSEDNPESACKGIPSESCRQMRYNFTVNVANGAASKLAEQIAGPNLILPWLLQLIGAPVWMFGFLMPIKQSFSLLPQMLVAGRIRQLSRRKGVWVGAGLSQALCLLLMIPATLWLPPVAAGLSLLLLLILFSAASGTASIAFQEVLGKTIAAGRRGRLLARRALIGGILTTLAGFVINRLRTTGQSQEITTILLLLFIAALLWGLAALFFALTREFPGAVQGGRNTAAEARAGWRLFTRYRGYRHFLYGRSLLLTVELATPFFVLHAGQVLNLQVRSIGALMIAIGVAQIISSPFWGKMADQTSKKVMSLSAIIAAGAALAAILLEFIPFYSLQYIGYFMVFVLIGLAEAGVRLGRKTYLVDAAPPENRATFTAFSNSVVGILAIFSGALAVIAQWLGATAMLIVIALLMLAGHYTCRRMPEAEQMLSTPPEG